MSADAVVVVNEDVDAPTPSVRPIRSDLKLALGDNVVFNGFGLETKIRGAVRLQQTDNQLLRAEGKLQLVEGRYKAYGQNLKINNGDLIFVDDIENPQLRLEAVRDNLTTNNVVVGLRAIGAAQNPQIRLYSQPDMADQAKLSYLLTGNPPGSSLSTDPSVMAAEAALSYALESDTTKGITGRAAETLGIKDLSIATNTNEDGTQVGVSGYLTPNLLVRYGVGVFDAANSLTLRYQLSKNVVIEAVSSEKNNAMDLLWSFDKE